MDAAMLDDESYVSTRPILRPCANTFKLLHISLYFNNPKGALGKHGSHDRLRTISGQLPVDEILSKEMSTRRGSMLVATCADRAVRQQGRDFVNDQESDGLHYYEHTFQPWKTRHSSARSRGLSPIWLPT